MSGLSHCDRPFFIRSPSKQFTKQSSEYISELSVRHERRGCEHTSEGHKHAQKMIDPAADESISSSINLLFFTQLSTEMTGQKTPKSLFMHCFFHIIHRFFVFYPQFCLEEQLERAFCEN